MVLCGKKKKSSRLDWYSLKCCYFGMASGNLDFGRVPNTLVELIVSKSLYRQRGVCRTPAFLPEGWSPGTCKAEGTCVTSLLIKTLGTESLTNLLQDNAVPMRYR